MLGRSVIPVETTADPETASATLLVSHVLSELNESQLGRLLDKAAEATAILWVEPGTHETSRRLIAVREQLRSRFRLVAPCTHQGGCGLLATGMERHWCHQFARPPGDVFTDGHWARFGRLAGIDLRSLPLSFLVLDRRAIRPLPADAMRIIGRPRVGKAFALLFGCDASGVAERRATKRDHPDAFRRFKRGDYETLARWQCQGDRIVRLEPFEMDSGEATG